MRVMLSALVLSLVLVGVAGTAAAQPCQPWCLDLDDQATEASSGLLGTAQAVIPLALAGLAVALRRRRIPR